MGQTGAWRELRRGDIVEGLVVGRDQDGILVNFGGKSEGIVPLREARTLSPQALEAIKPGDTLRTFVLRPEREGGPALLSLDRARVEEGWRLLEEALEKGATITATAVAANRGGLVVMVEGVQGFVPLSHLAPRRGAGPQVGPEARVGEQLALKVLDLNRRRNRAILSERLAWQEWREQQKERLLRELRQGEVRRGRITGIASFGAFVDLGGADGLIHISELSWRPVRSPEEVVRVGDEVEVYVLKVDPETRKISLSLRRLQPEPWETVAQRYQVGQLVQGTITRLAPFGAFARIDEEIEGLIHISELSPRVVHHPKEVVKEGDVVTLKILRIEPERRRLGLSLKQALEEV